MSVPKELFHSGYLHYSGHDIAAHRQLLVGGCLMLWSMEETFSFLHVVEAVLHSAPPIDLLAAHAVPAAHSQLVRLLAQQPPQLLEPVAPESSGSCGPVRQEPLVSSCKARNTTEHKFRATFDCNVALISSTKDIELKYRL